MKKQFELYTVEPPLNVFASPRMIATLKKCYDLELSFPGKPYGPKDLRESFSGLYKRGLLDIDISNKNARSGRWYITTKGFQFLLSISGKRIAANDPLLLNNIDRLRHNLERLQNSMHNLKITSGRITN